MEIAARTGSRTTLLAILGIAAFMVLGKISITLRKLMKTRKSKRKALLPDTKLTKYVIQLVLCCDLTCDLT